MHLRLDSAGHPRILYAPAYAPAETPRIGYASCDQDCARGDAWTVNTLPTHGTVPLAFVLDATGRPHVADVAWRSAKTDGVLVTRQALGYAACEADCDTSTGSWKTEVIQPASSVIGIRPPAPGAFIVGTSGSIALDPSDARFAYEVDDGTAFPGDNGVCTPTILRYSAF